MYSENMGKQEIGLLSDSHIKKKKYSINQNKEMQTECQEKPKVHRSVTADVFLLKIAKECAHQLSGYVCHCVHNTGKGEPEA